VAKGRLDQFAWRPAKQESALCLAMPKIMGIFRSGLEIIKQPYEMKIDARIGIAEACIRQMLKPVA
jgi:hypothetical protein